LIRTSSLTSRVHSYNSRAVHLPLEYNTRSRKTKDRAITTGSHSREVTNRAVRTMETKGRSERVIMPTDKPKGITARTARASPHISRKPVKI
jgi:hypothetical protein